MPTQLLLHCDGAEGSQSFPDSSSFPGKPVSVVGGTYVYTVNYKFGGGSAKFQGSDDRIVAGPHANLAPGSSWTIEAWVRPAQLVEDMGIFHLGSLGSDNNRALLEVTSANKLRAYINNAGAWYQFETGAGALATTQTKHVAMVKSGTTLSVFCAGNRLATFDTGKAGPPTDNTVTIGRTRSLDGLSQNQFEGWIDEIRFTPGEALYTTATYTSPSAAFPDPVTVDYLQPTAPILLTVTNASEYTPAAPILLTVAQHTYAPAAPIELSVHALFTPAAPIALAVHEPGLPTNWGLRCLLNGVDVSARLRGMQSVEAEEGAARIASLQLLPPAGALDVLDYVGVPVVLDFVRRIGAAEVPVRVFTGRVDTPTYDMATRTLALSCTDDMQNRVAAMSTADIDALIPGRYSVAVQGEQTDNWDYAVARMTTVPGSLDCDANGGLRVTMWDGLPLYDTLDDTSLLWPAQPPEFPQRTEIINRVEIDYAYRYARVRQRNTTVGFSATRADMDKCGYVYPSFSEIYSAVSGAGWVITQSLHTNPPATIPHSTGGVVRPRSDACDLAIFWLTQRHGQSISEAYSITVEAPESVAQNGTLPHSLTGALEETEFDYRAWETDYGMAPLMPAGGEQDYAPTATREASDYAIQTLLDQARVKILGSHRGATVSNATPCNPRIDLDKRLAIDTAELQAEGKVRRVRHAFDLAGGSAITEFSLAIFGAGGAGILTPDDLDPPEPPAEETRSGSNSWTSGIPSLTVAVHDSTPYSDSLMGLLVNPEQFYTVEDVPDGLGGFETIAYENPHYVAGSYDVTGFRVEMPGVDDEDRQPVTLPVAQSYSIVLPADTLIITVP